MDTRIRSRLQSLKKTPLNHEKVEVQGKKLSETTMATSSRRFSSKERKMALQQDVDKLKNKLKLEESVHRALERAFNRPLGALPRFPPFIPSSTLELLAEVAVLEEEVVRLEEQVVHYRQGLYREAVYISSSKRNIDNSIELYELHQSKTAKSQQSKSSAKTAGSVAACFGRNLPSPTVRENGKGTSIHKAQTNRTPIKGAPANYISPEKRLERQRLQLECRVTEQEIVEAATPIIPSERPSGDDSPNKVSENILKCLLTIFTRMSSTKNIFSAEAEFQDPYGISSQFGNRDIGPYKQLCAIDAGSINPDRAVNCSFLVRRLKFLLGKLASVNLQRLGHQEKLAFWINIYNSCMMNAFLEHGIPESPEMIVAMMQKATINVGGQLLNAITIEHFILRLPYHSKYTFSKVSKNDDMKVSRINGLDLSEPLITFALSCGNWSSPAVRVYTASQVENELEVAKREYLQAAVGISTNKCVIPKLLDWYLLDFAKDLEAMLDWICLQLPSEQGKEAIKCLEGRKNEPLSQFVQVMPYEFSFRYLLYI